MVERKTATRRHSHSGFTLIEILIVVVILGILSSIVIPQFTTASHQTREATLKDCLRYLRTQVQVYKAQHANVPPGFPDDDPGQAPDATTFVAQMTQYTDDSGHVNGGLSDVYRWGPYLSEMPANPMTSTNGILVVEGPSMPAPNPSQPYGWIYNPRLQQIRANLLGTDEAGTPYAGY